MPRSGRNQDRVARNHRASLSIDLDRAFALEEKVKFLAQLVVMPIGGTSRGNAGLGKTLVEHGRVGAVEDAPNPRTVLRREGFLTGYV